MYAAAGTLAFEMPQCAAQSSSQQDDDDQPHDHIRCIHIDHLFSCFRSRRCFLRFFSCVKIV